MAKHDHSLVNQHAAKFTKGSKWRLNRAPTIVGILRYIAYGAYIHCEIIDDHADFRWIGTCDEFIASWTKFE